MEPPAMMDIIRKGDEEIKSGGGVRLDKTLINKFRVQ